MHRRERKGTLRKRGYGQRVGYNVFYLVLGHVIVMGHFEYTVPDIQKSQ